MTDTKNPGGRPSDYRIETATILCEYLAIGESLRTATKHKGMPSIATVFKWMREHKEFLNQYCNAKQESADAMAEEILDIADESDVAIVGDDKSDGARVMAKKLRVDTRKWIMARMKPKKYGDKLDVTSDGKALPTPIYGGKSVKTI